ncbi:DEAD/DEAH box helicase [Halalkalibacterium ligniniphilum]|uniref:DEAD/DEAH box helicase n=1 Tax=Halalkalibacterium ligniniphilum TaxID=1134413 RepID=UPI00034A08A9|nr:DEAD/DEAH box helicase [Halalkalibacterium ligniniphilum]
MKPNFIVHGGWLEERFFIWAEKSPRSKFEQMVPFQYPFLYSPFELKLAIFRHDQPSYYGTFLETDKAILEVPLEKRTFRSPAGTTTVYQAEESMTRYRFPIEGIVLSGAEIFDHYHTLHSLFTTDEWEIGDDFRFWLHFFAEIEWYIKEGQIIPSASGHWQLKADWKNWEEIMPHACLSLSPNSALIQDNVFKHLSVEKRLAEIGNHLADAWIRLLLKRTEVSKAFSQWQKSTDKAVQPALKALTSDQSPSYSHVSMEGFLEKVGAVPVAPFVPGLALKEPVNQDGDWSLALCVVDRQSPSFVVEMNELEKGQHPWRSNPIALLKTQLTKVKEHLSLLQPLSLASPVLRLSSDDAYQLFTDYHDLIEDAGFHLIVPRWLKDTKHFRVHLKMDVHQNQSQAEPLLNWQSLASFHYEVAIGDTRLTEEEFSQYVESQRPFIYRNGQWVAWDPELAEQLRSYLDQLHKQTNMDAWRLEQNMNLEVEGIEKEVEWEIEWGEDLEKALDALYRQNPSPLPALPRTLKAELRSYQEQGVAWLVHLREVGFGGCLADDMGLGKSVQTITYMLHILQEQEADHSPFLLICPTSLIFNWVHECKRFAPSLRVYVHHGSARQTEWLDKSKWDLVITSYPLAVRDEEFWHQMKWNGLILDEAQHIKNTETKQRQAIKKIKASHRIALTGTPIENRLKELWSLMDVLNPSYLGTFQQFLERFIRPIERDGNEQQLTKLQQLIRPLLLRRKKSDASLQLQLPKKLETIHRVHLSLEQAALYQAVVDELLSEINRVSQMERRALILKSLTKLKQICNHPAHFLKDKQVERHQSDKWDLLLTLSDQIIDQGEKMLIFTQFKEMGTLITNAFQDKYGKEIPFLHGSLTRQKRQEAIEQFQENKEIPAFVLSLKAGGVGLNLTAANHVIHYDRWWNPAVENQATDRAYRIGQTEDVTVHKLITEGTLEERIDQMLSEKQALAEQVLSTGTTRFTEMSNEELYDLIRL